MHARGDAIGGFLLASMNLAGLVLTAWSAALAADAATATATAAPSGRPVPAAVSQDIPLAEEQPAAVRADATADHGSHHDPPARVCRCAVRPSQTAAPTPPRGG
ncbi:hypothetical protein [Streptomyces sp. NPDC051364]|uniref:hypothetical protein n=1 Tax=Streptomyces sp. NPDC051364 TaxID=3155799 RepID=UPI00342CC0CE